PHLPEISGACRCRKPGVELFERAAAEHNLDLAKSWFVGDRARDVEPALTLGGRGLLVVHEDQAEDVQRAARLGLARAADLLAAASIIGALGP
ncbi:MAG: HAD hydrolase-like protein, partial [Gemmatimonadota bacterium]